MDKPYEKSPKVEAPAKVDVKVGDVPTKTLKVEAPAKIEVEVKVGDVPAEAELELLKSGDPCPNRANKYLRGPHRGQIACKEGRVIASPSQSEVLVCGECGGRWLSDRTVGPSEKRPSAKTDREIAAPHGPEPEPEPASVRRSIKSERIEPPKD